jgi:hypothetical protein
MVNGEQQKQQKGREPLFQGRQSTTTTTTPHPDRPSGCRQRWKRDFCWLFLVALSFVALVAGDWRFLDFLSKPTEWQTNKKKESKQGSSSSLSTDPTTTTTTMTGPSTSFDLVRGRHPGPVVVIGMGSLPLICDTSNTNNIGHVQFNDADACDADSTGNMLGYIFLTALQTFQRNATFELVCSGDEKNHQAITVQTLLSGRV